MCLFSFRADVRCAASAKIRYLLSQPRSITDLFHSTAPFKLIKCYPSTAASFGSLDARSASTAAFDLQKLMSVAFGAYDLSIRVIAMRQIRIGLREYCTLLNMDVTHLESMAVGCMSVLSGSNVSDPLEPRILELQLEAASLIEVILLFDKHTRSSLGVGLEFLDLTPLLLLILQFNYTEKYSYNSGRIAKDVLLLTIFRVVIIWSLSFDNWDPLALEYKNSPEFFPEFLQEHFGIVDLAPGHLALVDETFKHYLGLAGIAKTESSSKKTSKSNLGEYLGFVFESYSKCRSSISLNT